MLVTCCNISNLFWHWCRRGSNYNNVWMTETKRWLRILKLCIQPC